MWRRVQCRGITASIRSLTATSHSVSTGSPLVTSVIKDQIGIITLCDPSRLNALSEDMGEQFVASVDLMKKVC
jgi:hypothetical protein